MSFKGDAFSSSNSLIGISVLDHVSPEMELERACVME